MKSVFILEDSSKSYYGGGQQISLLAIKILREKGVRLYLADYTSKSLFNEKVKIFIPFDRQLILKGKGTITNSSKDRFYKTIEIVNSLFLFPINAFRIKKFLSTRNESEKTVVFYCTTKKTLLVSFLYSLLFNVEYIYHSHMVMDLSGIIGFCLKHALLKAKKVICVSNTVKNNLNFPNTVLLFNSLEDDAILDKKYLYKKKIVVAAIGSLIYIKGFEYLIKSYDELKNKDDVEIRIYGVGALWNHFLSLKKSDNIKLMGFNENILDELLNDVDIVVVPSIIPEALSMVIVQAKKVGLPCIVTNIGGQSEIIMDGIDGFCIPIMDAKSIAEKIDLLISDRNLYLKMAHYSHLSYVNYSFDKFKTGFLSIIFESIF
ncbi:MAG: hypothetical protein PARBA_00185 [Parabacteroides sp.]